MSVSKPHGPVEPVAYPKELGQYSGKWVALVDGEVVAAGTTTSQLALELKRLGIKRASTQFIAPPSTSIRVGVG